MLLTFNEFQDITQESHKWGGHIAFDFETDGLNPYASAHAFIMGFTDPAGKTYSVFLEDGIGPTLEIFFSNGLLKYCAHNAKFELGFLEQQYMISPQGVIWDTEVMARVENSSHMSYSLQACAQRKGLSKYPPMLEWLKQKGNKAGYHRAPRELIIPYVEQDAYLSWKECSDQIETFKSWDCSPWPIKAVVQLELQVLKPLFEMESRGLLTDVEYCKRALAYERNRIAGSKAEFEKLTATQFVDSRKTLAPIFDSHGICYARTALGNASFTAEALEGASGNPIVAALLAHRGAVKRASTYWENFIEMAVNGLIHPSIHQNRAVTGRMSISNPSFQNCPTDNDDPLFPIRRAFIARPGCKIASLDYSQMELRLMCDEAQDTGMIEAIRSGRDFHQETADAAGVPRDLAKNGRFAKLYGAGVPRVATTLGISEMLAASICEAIDESSPAVARYCWGLIKYAERATFGTNFLGRRYYFDKGFAYKYPNYRIQGGCGEILRRAIIEVYWYLKTQASSETFMLMPVHDEIVLNIHERDMGLLPKIKQLMIEAHRSKQSLDMDVSVHVGDNFHDLEKVNV